MLGERRVEGAQALLVCRCFITARAVPEHVGEHVTTLAAVRKT
jgi:hypothetical protein